MPRGRVMDETEEQAPPGDKKHPEHWSDLARPVQEETDEDEWVDQQTEVNAFTSESMGQPTLLPRITWST